MTSATTAKRWVIDTSCGTLICNTQHGLRGVRKLKQVEAIGSDNLVLPNGLVICLDNYHYAPTIARGVVLVSHLVDMHNLDSTYLCHCRLAHISKKRIGKLQHDGSLKSMDDESFDQATSLPLRMNLLKHKHEVFETFKVFKNEVENQLGKTIKVLRSDRGGEYISQEFKDYLKACGIVQQLTPPYTPQHNGVSERRNRTLLDMD
ncbi:retrotransposon protein, putative, ty1-copia subclass [Tanacetum coccineum]